MSKFTSENDAQMIDDNARSKIVLLEITPESDTRELLFRLVEMLGRRGIKVIPARKGSLLNHDA